MSTATKTKHLFDLKIKEVKGHLKVMVR